MILQEESDEKDWDQKQRFNCGQQSPQHANAATCHSLAHGHGNGARVNACQQQSKQELVPSQNQTEHECGSKPCKNLRQAYFEKHLRAR